MKFKTLSLTILALATASMANAGVKHDSIVASPVAQYKSGADAQKYAKATVEYLIATNKNDVKAQAEALSIIQNDAGSNLNADYFLGQLYRTGKVVGKTQVEGLTLLKKAADGGIVEAQHDYGMALYIGDAGAKKDQKKALDYFTSAASKGLGNSYHNICIYYEQGVSPIKKDLVKAETCFKNSANKYNVAQSFGKFAALKLQDTKLDKAGEQEALKYAINGGNLGDVGSLALAGTTMLTAKHNTPNLVGGFKNIQASAELGYKPAFKILANLYSNGIGVVADKEIAAIWEKRSIAVK